MEIQDYIKQLLAYEEYSSSLEEVLEKSGKSEVALRSALARLVEKKELINLRKAFYLIITPRYSVQQKLPIHLYSEKLFKYLERKYYLGLFTAAKFHGAIHQQIQQEYIITKAPKFKTIVKNKKLFKFNCVGLQRAISGS